MSMKSIGTGFARRWWLRWRWRLAPAQAQKKYDPGATDTEILIGQTNPYSGALASYATQGRVQDAYYKMINEQGGVNGRKIKLIYA